MQKLELGTVIVRSDGKGYWSNAQKTVPLKIVVQYDPKSIEYGDNGEIEYVYCMFQGFFSRAHWNVSEDGLLYTDKAVQRQINEWLVNLGYTGKVGWSEQGRQEMSSVDFDMDYALLPQMFPDMKEAA